MSGACRSLCGLTIHLLLLEEEVLGVDGRVDGYEAAESVSASGSVHS